MHDRAVRFVPDNESQTASHLRAVMSISAKIGCAPQILNACVRKAAVDSGKRSGIPTAMADHLKARERENRKRRSDPTFLLNPSAAMRPVRRFAREVSVGVHRERSMDAVGFVELLRSSGDGQGWIVAETPVAGVTVNEVARRQR